MRFPLRPLLCAAAVLWPQAARAANYEALDAWLNMYKLRLATCGILCEIKHENNPITPRDSLYYSKSRKQVVILLQFTDHNAKKEPIYLGFGSFPLEDLKSYTRYNLYPASPQQVFVDGEQAYPPESQIKTVSYCLPARDVLIADSKQSGWACLDYAYKTGDRTLAFKDTSSIAPPK